MCVYIYGYMCIIWASQMALVVKKPLPTLETQGGEDPWVEKIPWRKAWQEYSGTLAWRIPWTEEPGRLQS